MSAKIITFEGIDGSGKTMLVNALRDHYAAQGKTVWATREPWSINEVDPDPFVATLELMVDRRRHCDVLRTASYDIALIDRFDLSTEAYQGYGDGVDRDLINTLNDIATEGIDVSMRLWLDVPVDVAVQRIRSHRGQSVSEYEIARLERVRAGYAELADEGWMVRIDATQPREDVLRDAIALIDAVL